ncbi:MAG: pyridoxal phosphate-dependent aminotransferase [Alphaproteobacteria bacterium]|nr:pyridoxal phosphate-dependent aminotransferase [Alphaproteobacteria bacterium]
MTKERLAGMHGIGVDRMGAAADEQTNDLTGVRPVEAAANEIKAGILRLENFDTDLRSPPAAIAETKRAVEDDAANSYLPFIGQDKLRQAVARHVGVQSGLEIDWRRQVVITAGGLNGVLVALLALTQPGDEVVMTDPTYIGMINRVCLAGAVPRLVAFAAESGAWRLDFEALRRSINPKTRTIFIMSPSMPSGAVLNQAEWSAIAELCADACLLLLYNAAMERIVYDGRSGFHPASIPAFAGRTVTIGSVSKEHCMIGWRVGWVVAAPALIDRIALVQISDVVVPVGIAQGAATVALEEGSDAVIRAVAEWQRRRDMVVKELDGLPVIAPAGGWSMLLDTGALGHGGEKASALLLEKARIAATPMVNWGEVNGRQFVRFVFSNEPVGRLRGMGAKVRHALGCA